MISFIIIGKNEGWKLSKCLNSVKDTIEVNKLEDAEIIYVDSDSSDDSIARALSFKHVTVYKITGECNAAVGRNVGARAARGEILFFIDGDMEIKPSFLKLVINDGKLRYDLVTGHIIEKYYDQEGNLLGKKNRTFGKELPAEDEKVSVTGGLFLISKKTWNSVNEMNERFWKSQDLDLCLRLCKKKADLVRKNAVFAVHHTTSYLDYCRFMDRIKSGVHFYTGLLLRNHLKCFPMWKLFFRQNYALIFLLITCLCIIARLFPPYFIFAYFLLTLARVFVNTKVKNIRLFCYAVLYIMRDIQVLYSVFFFYPKQPQYSVIKIVEANTR